MRNDNKKSMTTNRDYELIVWRFVSQTRVILNPIDALGFLGSVLYLRKRHIIIDASSLYNIIVSSQKGNNNDNSLSVAYSFLLNCYSKLSVYSSYSDILLKFQDTLQTILNLAETTFPVLFEIALEMVAKSFGKQGGEFYQPKEIAQLVAKLVCGSHNNIYNPFSGVASYAEAMNGYDHFYGVELDKTVYNLSILRLAISDKLDKVSIKEGDVRNWTSTKYNVIVTTPPFAARIEMTDNVNGEREFSDTVALSRFEKTTTTDGQLCTVVRSSLIWSADAHIMKIRKKLIDKGFVEKVIVLPGNIYYGTTIPLSIIYLNKKNKHRDSVELIDGTDCFIVKGPKNILDVDSLEKRIFHDNVHRLIVPVSTICENLYALDYQRYKKLSELVVPEGYEVHKLKEIISAIQPIRRFPETKGNIVTVSAISNDPYDCMKIPVDFPVSDNLRLATKLVQPALVVSMIRTPKCCYIDASEDNPVFLNPNVRVFKVNVKVVTPEYLCLQLSKQDVSTAGAAIPYITLPMLLSLRIVLPSLETQNNVFAERMQEDKLVKARELGLQDVIVKMKEEYINEVRMRKHDMRPYLREISSALKLMQFYMSKKSDMPSFCEKMDVQLANSKKAVAHLSDLLENLSSEEKFGEPTLIDINDYLMNDPKLRDHKATVEQPGWVCDYDCDDKAFKDAGLPYDKSIDVVVKHANDKFFFYFPEKEKVPHYVEMATADWDRLVVNILENSRKHGFTEIDKKYNFHINLSVETHFDKVMYVIDFDDNGKPLPDGMNKQRYGLLGEKAGVTAGTGQGGSIVKRIVEHYGGDYNIFSNGEGTTVRIWLPIPKEVEE